MKLYPGVGDAIAHAVNRSDDVARWRVIPTLGGEAAIWRDPEHAVEVEPGRGGISVVRIGEVDGARSQRFDSGAAQELLDRWVDVVRSRADDLVATDVIESDAASVAAFLEPQTSG